MDGGGEGLLVQQVSDRRYPAGDQRERGLSEEAADVVVERCMDVFVPFLQIKQEEQRQYYRTIHFGVLWLSRSRRECWSFRRLAASD